MIKLIVCDLDGTLLPYGQDTISERILVRIDSLLSKGLYFAVSSGRVYSELVNYLPSFADRIYFVSSDGALITHRDKVIFHKYFSCDALSFAINSSSDTTLLFYGQKDIYSYNCSESDILGTVKILKPFDFKSPIYKIVSKGVPIKNFEGLYSRIHYSDGMICEYVPPYTNKGVALGALQRHLGVSVYETLAIGDSVNDIPMMKNAKYSCAIGNSSPRLNGFCRFFFESVDTVLEKVWINHNFDV